MKYYYVKKQDDVLLQQQPEINTEEKNFTPDTQLLIRHQHTATSTGCTYSFIENESEYKQSVESGEQIIRCKDFAGSFDAVEVKQLPKKPLRPHINYTSEHNDIDDCGSFLKGKNSSYNWARLFCCCPCFKSEPPQLSELDVEQTEGLIKPLPSS